MRADLAPAVGATEVPLRVESVSISFDGQDEPVLDGVSVDVGPREFVSLLGPSGCGKSTLLNVAAGLIQPNAGTVTVCDRRLTGVNTSVGYMTQDDTLLPWRTVRGNVALPLRLRSSLRGRDIADRVDAALDAVDLGAAARKFPSQLSGGMRRRALLARSLIYEPPLLLMDEPFGALDAQLRAELQASLRRSVTESHQAVLFVTHDVSESVLLADRVIVMGERGHIVGEVPVPLGDERDIESLAEAVEYLEIARAVRAALNRARSGHSGDPGEPDKLRGRSAP